MGQTLVKVHKCDVIEKLAQANTFRVLIKYFREEAIYDLKLMLLERSLRISDSTHVLAHLRRASAQQVPAQAASSMPDRV